MNLSHIETSGFKDVTVISAHEGSYSWVKTLGFMEGYINLNYVTIISDAQYRSLKRFRRIINKILIYLVFPLKVFFSYRRIRKSDFVIVITSPFYMPLLGALLFRSEKLLVLHNDLYPEGLSQVHFLNKFRFFFGFYRFLSDKLLYDVSKNIFLSASHFSSREYRNKCIIYTPAVSRQLRKNKNMSHKPQMCHVGYIGTMGYNHCGLEFLHLFDKSKLDFSVEFDFNISGALASKFGALVLDCYNLDNRLRVSGSLDESDYHNAMLETEFGLILLSPKGGGTVFPSKFAAHLSYGHPIILISDQENDLHDFVIQNSIGVSISLTSNDLNDLNDFMANMRYDSISRNALAVYNKYFHYQNIGRAFLKEIEVHD